MKMPISAARVIIEDVGGKILFLKRANSQHGNGILCLPGGKVDYGKTIEQTAINEVKEETNLKLRNLEYLFYSDGLPTPKDNLHVITHYFHAYPIGRIKLNEESSGYFWLWPSEIENYEIGFGNDDAVRKYFSEDF